MKTSIIYFSPTGGTEHVAQLISKHLGLEAPFDYTLRGYDIDFAEDDLLFLCFPVYGGRVPSPMYDRVRCLHGSNTRVALVAVYGNRAVDDALLEMSDLCLKQGFTVIGGCEMIAPHSIDKRFASDRPDTKDIQVLHAFADAVVSKEDKKFVSMPGSRPYRKYEGIGMVPTSGSKCSGCGTCSMECPTEAIDPEKPKNTNKEKCISCMRCVSVCPFGGRKLPAPMQLAASASLIKLCAGRKEAKYYI